MQNNVYVLIKIYTNGYKNTATSYSCIKGTYMHVCMDMYSYTHNSIREQ